MGNPIGLLAFAAGLLFLFALLAFVSAFAVRDRDQSRMMGYTAAALLFLSSCAIAGLIHLFYHWSGPTLQGSPAWWAIFFGGGLSSVIALRAATLK